MNNNIAQLNVLKRNTPIRVWAGMKNFCLGIPMVGIVRKVPSTRTQIFHKHPHHPFHGMLTIDTPDRTRATPLEGVGQERFSLV
jgi:hypothetical protein